MASQKRPGGLTALAVLNFVFAGFALLGVIGMLVVLKFADVAMESGSAEDKAVMLAFKDMGMGLWGLIVGASVITGAILVVAGVGYLKSKRWGRTSGNLYAVLAIVTSVAQALALPELLGGGFTIGTMIGLVYPVLTLILLNTAFKDDFY